VAAVIAERTPAASVAPAAETVAPAAEPEPAAPDGAGAPDAEDLRAAPGMTPEEEAKEPDRFRFKNPEDRAIALLAKTKGISLTAAAKLYAGDAPPAAGAGPAAAPAPAVDADLAFYDGQLGGLEAQVKKLSDERKQAREDVDNEKGDTLSDSIAELKTQIGLLKNERQGHIRNREQAVTQSFEQQATASRDRLLTEHTELASEGSLHRMAFDSFVSKSFADPKRASLFSDPSWPEKLGAEFAQAHGMKKGATAPAAAPTPGFVPAKPTTTPPAALLRSKAVQVPGAKGLSSADGVNPSAAGAPTRAELMAALPNMSAEQRKALIRSIPTAPRS
jgi:hypothetical protein